MRYVRTSPLCGTELFDTQRPRLDCSPLPAGPAGGDWPPAGEQLPDRAFGVEQEMLARDPRDVRGVYNGSIAGLPDLDALLECGTGVTGWSETCKRHKLRACLDQKIGTREVPRSERHDLIRLRA